MQGRNTSTGAYVSSRTDTSSPVQDVLAANADGIKLFNKWSVEDVEVKDISLTDYIQVRNAVLLPHTAGRYANKQFRKAQMPIVERLVNS
jgi:small subunit ribosomal protein S5e